MSLSLLNSGTAAMLLFGNCIAAKMFVSTLRGLNKDKAADFEKKYRAAQMNEMEYSGVIIAVLLFLKSRGDPASLGATLVGVGNVGYTWVRSMLGETGIAGFPFYVPFAAARYFGMLSLVSNLYAAV